MADPTPLAQRLVEAARQAEPVPIRRSNETWNGTLGELARVNAQRRAEATVVAVFRELDAVLEEERRDYLSQERLRALADSIEKGLAQ